MSRDRLPKHFHPPPPLVMSQLREIQAARRGDPEVRALLAEIKRLHGVLEQINHLRESIDRAWGYETHSRLAALHSLRVLLSDEPAIQPEMPSPR